MGKPTQKQKIKRNIYLIFNVSQMLALKYPEYKISFYKAESSCHFILLHGYPYSTIQFDAQIEQLKKMVSAHKYDRVLQNYYICLIKTNDLIKKLSKKLSKR